MARARNIKPGFFRNADLVELPMEARLLFIGLWTLADREGRLEDRPKQIKMEIFPADSVDCDALLMQLSSTGMVARYEVDGKRYLQVVNFTKHQNPHRDEKASTVPDQEGNLATPAPAPKKHGADTVQTPGEDDASTVSIGLNPDPLNPDPPTETAGEPALPAASDAFDHLWAVYPKKVGKDAARKAFAKRRPNAQLLAQMLAAVTAQAASAAWAKDGGQYIPNPATWLNEGRWQDETAAATAGTAKRGTDEYAALHRSAGWWREAGFANVWDAMAAKCWHDNADQFRDGKRAEVAA